MAPTAGTESITPDLVSLPLDDPRWVPMVDYVFARLSPRLGGRGPAGYDLGIALAEGRLRCLTRYRTHRGVWERKQVSLLCWIGRELHIWSDGKLTVHRQQNWSCPKSWANPRLLSVRSHDRGVVLLSAGFNDLGFSQPGFGNGILYAWLPDLERIWPAVFPRTAESERQAEPEAPAPTSVSASARSQGTERSVQTDPPARLTRLQEMERAGFFKRTSALQDAAAYAREACPPDGRVPDDVTPTQFARGLERWLKARGKVKAVPDQWHTSNRFLQEFRRRS